MIEEVHRMVQAKYLALKNRIKQMECDTTNKVAAIQNIENQIHRLLPVPEGTRPGMVLYWWQQRAVSC